MKLKQLTRNEYNEFSASQRILTHEPEYSRRFASLTLNGDSSAFALSWMSDNLEPIILESKNKKQLWVGVDQRLTVIDKSTNEILLVLPLHSRLSRISEEESYFIILTEIEVLAFNSNASIRLFETMPELIESASFEAGKLQVYMTDGQMHELRI